VRPTDVDAPLLVQAAPLRLYWYSVTPTLSVDAAQLAVAVVAVIDENPGAPGLAGAAVSVVENDALLGEPELPAASRARTCTEYVVPFVSPVTETPELALTHVLPPSIEYW
jgi:hypothetical protein